MQNTSDNKLTAQPRTLSELACAYHVSKRTFKKWLSCDTLKDIQPIGNFYSIAQITRIVNHLGEP